MFSGRQKIVLVCAVALIVTGSSVLGLGMLGMPSRRANTPSAEKIGGPFTLTTLGGRRVSDADFRGKWMLLYFGYTHCPDICPTTLVEIAQVLDKLGALADQIQPLYITIDPERDSPETMAAYAKEFDRRIIGLSGTAVEIAAAARSYRVFYAKKQFGESNDDYAMEHSAFVYVVDPHGKYVTLFSPSRGQQPEQMAATLRELMAPSASP